MATTLGVDYGAIADRAIGASGRQNGAVPLNRNKVQQVNARIDELVKRGNDLLSRLDAVVEPLVGVGDWPAGADSAVAGTTRPAPGTFSSLSDLNSMLDRLDMIVRRLED